MEDRKRHSLAGCLTGSKKESPGVIVVALSFHSKDTHLADDLLRWIGKISDVSAFDCILVCDSATPFDRVIAIRARAEQCFKSATIVSTERSVSGWPEGPNINWRTAIAWGRINRVPLLFLETDAIPLKANWLQAIQADYDVCSKRHMGQIEQGRSIDLPKHCLSGVAVYGPEATWPIVETPRAFNVDFADLLVPDSFGTRLIQDFFGQPDLPPVFVENKTAPNHVTIDFIRPEAVIFHRDKTHSLIPLLAKRMDIAWQPGDRPASKRLTVVFPVHRGDLNLALRHATLLRKYGRWEHSAIVAYDPSLNDSAANQLRSMLVHSFTQVSIFKYPMPPIRNYPAVANWAFQSVAFHMRENGTPWLWFEADAVVLRSDWLSQLQAEYDRCRKPFMGPHVPGMRHANGTMIYPADGAVRMTRAMTCPPDQAFDMMNEEIMSDCHDCASLIFHTWSVLNGNWHPVPGGAVPANITLELANKIPRSAVMIHRVKDASLTDLLLTGRYKHQ